MTGRALQISDDDDKHADTRQRDIDISQYGDLADECLYDLLNSFRAEDYKNRNGDGN